MTPEIIDTHAHIHHRQFESDADATLQRAFAAGVATVVLIGTDAADTRRAIALARRHPGRVHVAAGLHPHDADQWGPVERHALVEEFIPDPLVVAVGEMGLDYYYKDKCDRANERRAFINQMAIARDHNRPVVIHCRDAYDDCLALVAGAVADGWPAPQPPSRAPQPAGSPPPPADPAHPRPRGVFHCWAGSLDHARAAIDLGFLLGIGGALTFPRSHDLRAQCAALGLDHLVLETDAPYIAPVPHRGKRNEPAYLTHVVDCLVETIALPPENIRQTTTANARRLYGL